MARPKTAPAAPAAPATPATPAPAPTPPTPATPTMAGQHQVVKETARNLVIGAILLLLALAFIWPWCKKQMKDITTRPASSMVNSLLQPASTTQKKEVVAPVDEWSPPTDVAGVFKFVIVYGGPVEVRLKRFDGTFEVKKRDPNGPSIDLGRFETIAFRSLGKKPVTNWVIFPN